MRGDLLALGAVSVLVSLSEHRRWRDLLVDEATPGSGLLLDSLEGGLEEAPEVIEGLGEALAMGSLAKREDEENSGRRTSVSYRRSMIYYLHARSRYGWNVNWAPAGHGVRLRISHPVLTEEVLDVELRQGSGDTSTLVVSRGMRTPDRNLAFKSLLIVLTQHLLGGTVTLWTGDAETDVERIWEVLDPYLTCLVERRDFSHIPPPNLRRVT